MERKERDFGNSENASPGLFKISYDVNLDREQVVVSHETRAVEIG